MTLAKGITGVLIPSLQAFRSSMILRFILAFFWFLLHLLVNIVHAGFYLTQLIQSYLISAGLLRKYQNFQLNKLNNLAIVVDSKEANNKSNIRQLLSWLTAFNINCITLYDMEGVLKETIEADFKSLGNLSKAISSVDEANTSTSSTSLYHIEGMTVEILSLSDGKEAVAKAASFLSSNYLKENSICSKRAEPLFTEADMATALKAVGYGGPEPDLLLVYGPARCHLGFPAWRLRYTEIIHMGSLQSMKHGALLKALYDFSKKHQNYGK